MPGRKYNSPNYRYGFNGKEKDQDGEFGSITNYDYGFRIYNPAVGRFLSVDPLTQSYPWYTPYQFAGNKPIKFIDLDGLEEAEDLNRLISIRPKITNDIRNNVFQMDKKKQAGLLANLDHANKSADFLLDRGQRFAGYNVLRFLEGRGGQDILSVNFLRQYSGFKTDYENLMERGVVGQLRNFIRKLPPGDYFNRPYYYPISQNASSRDYDNAFGGRFFKATLNFTIGVNDDGLKTIKGTAQVTFGDSYRWNRGLTLGAAVLGIGNHKKFRSLLDAGAKDFLIRSYFSTDFSYTATKIYPRIEYTEVDDLQDGCETDCYPVITPSHHYGVKEGEEGIINDYRETN